MPMNKDIAVMVAKMATTNFLMVLNAMGEAELSGDIRDVAREVYNGIGEVYAFDPEFFEKPKPKAKPKAVAKGK